MYKNKGKAILCSYIVFFNSISTFGRRKTHKIKSRVKSEDNMPTAPASQCPDCPKRAIAGSRHCAEHQQQNQSLDNSRTADKWRRENDILRPLYIQARWFRVRARISDVIRYAQTAATMPALSLTTSYLHTSGWRYTMGT